MNKRRYLGESIGTWILFGLVLGVFLTVLFGIGTDFVRIEGSLMKKLTVLCPVTFLLGEGFWMFLNAYSSYFSELQAILSMGGRRKEVFWIYQVRIFVTSMALGIVVFLIRIFAAGWEEVSGNTMFWNGTMILLILGELGSLLGCIQFSVGKMGFVVFILISMVIGGCTGLLFSMKDFMVFQSAAEWLGKGDGSWMISGAGALIVLGIHTAVTLPMMKRMEVRS